MYDRDLRRNGEGYIDLTAYEAIMNVEREEYMKEYINEKIEVLKDFCIFLNKKQLKHIRSLKTEADVDKYAKYLIMKS